jgi:hypothetical protein
MDYHDAIQSILAVEQKFDVNAVRFRGVRIWPLIRLQFWVQLIYPGHYDKYKKEDENNPLSSECIQTVGKTRKIISRTKQLLYELNQKYSLVCGGRPDVVLFSRCVDHADQLNGRYINRILDPLPLVAGSGLSWRKIEPYSESASSTLPRLMKTRFFRLSPSQTISSSLSAREIIAALPGLDALIDSIYEDTGVYIRRIPLARSLYNIDGCWNLSRKVLKWLRPRIVCFSCIDDEWSKAAALACNDLGIVSVECQHGAQGEYNSSYTHWNSMPRDGYEMLPDFFWVWGEHNRRNIERWLPAHRQRHAAVIGGYPWLNLWRDHMISPRYGEAEQYFLNDLSKWVKRIMVSLSWGLPLEELLPSFLLRTMRDSPDTWLWLIRMHPHLRPCRNEIHAKLMAAGVRHFEMDFASSMPLFELLRHIDHNILTQSSVGHEAVAFGKPSTIICRMGFELYKKYFGSGYFHFAESSEELFNSIDAGRLEQLKGNDAYLIDADTNYAKSAWNKIYQLRLNTAY